jgi:glutamyl-tRNA(Gln) amidotransferase subunit D
LYSEEVEKFLKKKRILVGDTVRISKKKLVQEGVLMPRIELGDSSSLVLKLPNGYNVGIKFEKELKIKKIGPTVKFGVIPAIKIKHRPDLPSVSLIATGGTIGTHVDYKTGGVYMCRKPEEILATTPELETIVNLKSMLRPFTVASEDMTYKHWQTLAEMTVKELKRCDGVIITHGTDCLHYTATALSFMLKNLSKPVVLTGAQRSPDRGSFDGRMNLICSGYFAGHSTIGEVVVVMHGSTNDDFCYAHRGTKVRKLHTSRRDAFRSVNDLPLARIWPNGKIEIMNENHVKRDNKMVKVDTRFEPKTALVKVYPNSDPSIIDWYIEGGYRGIVIEATGLGHVPTGESGTRMEFDKTMSWIPFIKKAVDRGIVVVVTSQCLYGRTHSFVYRNLRLLGETGAIFGEDMLPEVAYIKLGCLLGQNKNPEKVKNLMLTNLTGEITKETLPQTFLM